jgi:hypothetical protein
VSIAVKNTNAIPAVITHDMLFEKAGANRLPDRVKFDGPVFNGTRQYHQDPMASKLAYAEAIDSTFEWTERTEMFPGFTLDDLAVSANVALSRVEGFISQTVRRGMEKPATRRVPIGYNMVSGEMDYVVVPQGATSLPFRSVGKQEPWLEVGAHHGVPYIRTSILRGDQSYVEGLFQYIRDWAEHNSIYLGQVVDTNFTFVNMTRFDPTKVALTKKTETALRLYVRGPLKHMKSLLSKRQDTKTGLLMYGPPGGGKTMIVSLAEATAIAEGAAVIHCDPATGIDGLERANAMASRLMNAGHMVLIAFEDMEKLAIQNRAKVLEILDGASAKTARRIIIGTTNFIEGIDRAMIRHGRFDDILFCGLPDRQAFEQVIRVCFDEGDLGDIDFDFAFPYFNEYSYATIGNAASKIVRLAIDRLNGDLTDFKVTTQDLVDAAQMVRDQHDLVNVEPVKDLPVFDQLLREMLNDAVTSEVIGFIDDNVPFGDTTDYEEVQERAQQGADNAIEYRLNGATIQDRIINTN